MESNIAVSLIACTGEAVIGFSMVADGRAAAISVAGDTVNTAVYLP